MKQLLLLLLFAVPLAAQDMRIVISAQPRADRGVTFPIDLRYRNTGSTTATGVQITVQVNGQQTTHTIGNVEPSPNFNVLRVQGIAPDANEIDFEIQATIRSDNDPNPANDEDVATVRTFRSHLVTNTGDTGNGSLRSAIDIANADCNLQPGELCKIAFRIPVAPAQWATIRPATPLPAITASGVIIDGSTQTRIADTNPLGPEIEINGSLLTSGNGITLAAPCGSHVQEVAINGFPDNGVLLTGSGCESFPGSGIRAVYSNYIGTDPTGTQAVPNLRGIFVALMPDGRRFLHGWITHNVISGNRYSGIWVAFGQAGIVLNKIGLNATVTAGLGNGSSGVYVGAAGSGTGIGDNYIGFNGHYGISVDRRAERVGFSRNSIQANGNIGIDFGLDGVSPQVPAPNGNVLHAPVITSARYDTASDRTVIEGTVDVTTAHGNPRQFYVMLYANDEPDASGYGEGQYFLGQADVDAEGRFTFTHQGRTPGPWIAGISLATQFVGEIEGSVAATSEFSRTVEVSR